MPARPERSSRASDVPRLTEIAFGSARPVDGYGPGFFRVGGEVIEGACLVGADGARGWAGYDDTAPILGLDIDVLILGTGPAIAHPPAAFRAAVEGAGIGMEITDSATAARLYNLLLAEGRRVAAALIPVGARP